MGFYLKSFLSTQDSVKRRFDGNLQYERIMIEKPAKDIVREIVESNPFWEHFICIKGEIKESPQGLYIETSGHNTIPVDAGKAVIRPDGVRKYYGFLNFRDQEGFGEHKSARIDNVHFEMGSL